MTKKHRVSDFDVDFSSDVVLFSCCMDDVMERGDEEATLGMIIECQYCGAKMELVECKDGVWRWRGVK